jgi:DNA mismatch repair protein MutS
MTNQEKIEIINWKHPVIEEFLSLWENFIPNDLFMDYGKNNSDMTNIHIITWPNMWWKSTFLRQNALIVFLAHCGFWIPAQKWEIGLVDWIFARVWSGDVIAQNQSTFMTEMIEMSNILHNATRRSFVILDELGRWTSTYDWLALAKAIIIYLSQKIKSKILFATHYHELIKLEWKIDWIKNFSVWVYETDKEVVFLKKIVKWWANKSYGIDVAKLAWIPKEIIDKSKNYLKDLENNKKSILQTNLFEWNSEKEDIYKQKYQNLKTQIERIDINEITPIQSLQILNNLQNLIEDNC